MASRFVIHVGPPKTGTTYLQALFAQHRAPLAEQGVVYPVVDGTHYLASLDMRRNLFHGYERTHAAGQWQAFVDEAAGADGTIVMSSELLLRADPSSVLESARMLGPDIDVDVVLTLRDPGRLALSVWQNRVRDGGVRSFRADVAADSRPHAERGTMWVGLDLVDAVARWSAAVGPGRVTVVTSPAAGGDPSGLWTRMCEAVGIDHTALPPSEAVRTNESLGPVQVEVMRRINVALGGRMRPQAYVDQLKPVLLRRVLPQTPDNDRRAHLPADLVPLIERTSEHWIETIADSGVRVVGDLDDLRPRPTDGPAIDDVDEDEVLTVLVSALAELVASDDVLKRPPRARRSKERPTDGGADRAD